MPDVREEFEAWHHAEFGYCISEDGDPSGRGECSQRWLGWQASRAALKVELPERAVRNRHAGNTQGYVATEHWNEGFNDCLDRATEALQQAGIEVK